MKTITVQQLQTALISVCDKIIQAEPLLTELDTIIGDGDHGIGMRIGFSAMKKQLSDTLYETPYELLHEAGMTLIKVMGGTSGVIFGTLFIGGLSCIDHKKELSVKDFADYICAGTTAIAKRGKVTRGDKTMYDALAAKSGMENTKTMISRKGRSKNFRDRTIGHPDTGAVSTTIIFEALSESFSA